MYNAPSYPRPTKKEIEKYRDKQDGFYTLHYFVVKSYFDCMGKVGEVVNYEEKNFGYTSKILHKQWIENGKLSFGAITYQLVDMDISKRNS